MMDSIPQIMDAIDTALRNAGLESKLLWSESQFLFVGYNSILLVVSEGEKLDAVRSVIESVHSQLVASGIEFQYELRAKWTLDHVEDVQPLYSGDGGLRAASVITVHLKSGSAQKIAYVIVTWAADKAIRDIVPNADLRTVADALVRARLMRDGSDGWDPLSEPTIEVSAAAAPYVSHLLQRAA